MDRGLLRWILVIVAIVFAVLWLASTVIGGFSCPDWVPPSGLLAAVLAIAMP